MARRRKAEEKPLNDRERLEDYRRVMVEVRTTRLAREGGSYRVNIGAQDPAASTMPDADSIRSLFVTFRHVLAQQSDTQFTKVCKALDRKQLTDEEREVLKKCRALWKEVLSSDPLKS